MKASVVSLLFLTLIASLMSEAAADDSPAVLGSGQSPSQQSSETMAEHEAEVMRYRAERDATLRQPESWLTLVGLHWLDEGTTTVGSGEDMDLRLPDTAPDFVGELRVGGSGGESATLFVPAPRHEVRVDGQIAVQPVELRGDADGDPTQVEAGSVVFFPIDRRGRTAVRVKDRRARTLREFAGLDFYPIDWSWRVEGRFVPYAEKKEIQVPSVLGGTDTQQIPGSVEFQREGRTYRLDALDGGEGQLFLIFGDETNGKITYGGGRFLYATTPPDSSRPGPVVLDFNKAYSPPCVFSPWATCPLPPRQNRLALAIEAGEKTYRGYTEGSH
ncbi:MAG: DUF1684 domain-containing protein [Thermoanaerobaculia bacterium]|nr:DUF1684 domain-containing protein [Thermoanaerobaculia bacterium]